jgi:hypothetical protein
MKMLICGILLVLTSPLAFGQAHPGIYSWSITLKVADELGQPVDAAKVQVGYMQNKQMDGLTDSNGVFIATRADKSFALGFLITKEGYYSDYLHYELFTPGQFDEKKVNANRNATLPMILRRVGQPVSMYAKREETSLQQEDKPMGFDLSVGDWITPFGKGFHTDIFFAIHRKIIDSRQYDCILSVSFPNKGDGITVAPPEVITDSEFKTSRTAMENGYQPELDLRYNNTNQPESVFGYFIRVRTELDRDGKIQSALYGKISGNFRFYAGTVAPTSGMGFDYYVNPTPNDRNVEFDPKNNLVKDLKPIEAVKEP